MQSQLHQKCTMCTWETSATTYMKDCSGRVSSLTRTQCSKSLKSQTWTFFRLLRKIQIHQQTKGLILISNHQFNQVVVIKSEEITNKIQQKYSTKCKSIGSNFEDKIKSRKKSGLFSFAKAFWY